MVCLIDHCQQPTKGGLRVIFQIPKFLRVPESRVVGEHFGLLFGSGTRDPGELRVTKVYISGFPLLFPFMEFSLKASCGSGAERTHRHSLTSAKRTSCSACNKLFCSRAPSSLLFCGVRNTHKNLSFYNFSRNSANARLPPESFRTCIVCATHAHSHLFPRHRLLCHLGLY